MIREWLSWSGLWKYTLLYWIVFSFTVIGASFLALWIGDVLGGM